MSDNCTSPLGRRRPFILTLSIFSFIGISLILNSTLIGSYFNDIDTEKSIVSIVLVGLGVTILDFSADSCDSPLRAYLLDVCNTKDQDTGLNIHAFLGGTGAALGYVLTAINWSDLKIFDFIGKEEQIVYLFITIIFILCLISTMTSAKEQQYIPKNKTIKNTFGDKTIESSEYSIKISDNSSIVNNNTEDDDEDEDEEKAIGIKAIFKSFTDVTYFF